MYYSPDKDHLGATYSGTNAAANLNEMSALERERALREDVERKLHQLEHMVCLYFLFFGVDFSIFCVFSSNFGMVKSRILGSLPLGFIYNALKICSQFLFLARGEQRPGQQCQNGFCQQHSVPPCK